MMQHCWCCSSPGTPSSLPASLCWATSAPPRSCSLSCMTRTKHHDATLLVLQYPGTPSGFSTSHCLATSAPPQSCSLGCMTRRTHHDATLLVRQTPKTLSDSSRCLWRPGPMHSDSWAVKQNSLTMTCFGISHICLQGHCHTLVDMFFVACICCSCEETPIVVLSTLSFGISTISFPCQTNKQPAVLSAMCCVSLRKRTSSCI